jgi:hypothetical protein
MSNYIFDRGGQAWIGLLVLVGVVVIGGALALRAGLGSFGKKALIEEGALQTSPQPDLAQPAIAPSLSPEEAEELKTRAYCTTTKATNPESLKSLQLICADLCRNDEEFLKAHPGICKSEAELPQSQEPGAELQ